MVRLNEKRWVKAGIEFSDGYGLLSGVLTDEASDWATGRYQSDPTDFWVQGHSPGRRFENTGVSWWADLAPRPPLFIPKSGLLPCWPYVLNSRTCRLGNTV